MIYGFKCLKTPQHEKRNMTGKIASLLHMGYIGTLNCFVANIIEYVYR